MKMKLVYILVVLQIMYFAIYAAEENTDECADNDKDVCMFCRNSAELFICGSQEDLGKLKVCLPKSYQAKECKKHEFKNCLTSEIGFKCTKKTTVPPPPTITTTTPTTTTTTTTVIKDKKTTAPPPPTTTPTTTTTTTTVIKDKKTTAPPPPTTTPTTTTTTTTVIKDKKTTAPPPPTTTPTTTTTTTTVIKDKKTTAPPPPTTTPTTTTTTTTVIKDKKTTAPPPPTTTTTMPTTTTTTTTMTKDEKTVAPTGKQKEIEISKDPSGSGREGESPSNFPLIFMASVVVVVGGYFLYHNKSKIIALVVEGSNRGSDNSRGTPGYQKLRNLEEAMPGMRKHVA